MPVFLSTLMAWVSQIFVETLGFFLVVWTLYSAIRTIVLPRSANVLMTELLFRSVFALFRIRLRFADTYEERDRVMALFAPITLLLLPVSWIIMILLGYTVMFWGLGTRPWFDAFFLSGSSLFTLGFMAVDDLPRTVLVFSEATIGLGLIALLISYLPSIYSAFSRRESAVAMLEARAGSPPTPVELITRSLRIGLLHKLSDLWFTWEVWFAEVEESHTSHAYLVFFRSPQPDRSWITAAGCVLDAAALMASTVDTGDNGDYPPGLCIRAGFVALRRIADFYNIDYNADPQPTDPISIAKEEFFSVYEELMEKGVPVVADREQAWRDYAGWRVNYDAPLLALARLTMAPYAPWVSDRSFAIQPKAKGFAKIA
jgi:hypothetical protein